MGCKCKKFNDIVVSQTINTSDGKSKGEIITVNLQPTKILVSNREVTKEAKIATIKRLYQNLENDPKELVLKKIMAVKAHRNNLGRVALLKISNGDKIELTPILIKI